jgi:hypothetical protein
MYSTTTKLQQQGTVDTLPKKIALDISTSKDFCDDLVYSSLYDCLPPKAFRCRQYRSSCEKDLFRKTLYTRKISSHQLLCTRDVIGGTRQETMLLPEPLSRRAFFLGRVKIEEFFRTARLPGQVSDINFYTREHVRERMLLD